ncbi:MAG: hypothetical protein DMF95_30510, partial [Acidobacteria bacterium]
LRRFSSISARPVRAAEPCLSMFKDDGGVCTVSSSVRRIRSSLATLISLGVGSFRLTVFRTAAFFRGL